MKPAKNRYKDYFKNHYSAKFDDSDIERDKRWFYSQFQIIKSLISIFPASEILEIGSGFGGLYSFLNHKKYIGIEMDREVVNFANDFFKTDKFLNISLEEFNTKKKFDYIFAIEVLEHLDNPKEGIAKIHNLLNNQGMFIGTSPYPFKKNIDADRTHNFVLHPENWKRLFLNEGFSNVNLYPMSFFPSLWRISRYVNIKIPFYLPFKHFISTCLIIAKK